MCKCCILHMVRDDKTTVLYKVQLWVLKHEVVMRGSSLEKVDRVADLKTLSPNQSEWERDQQKKKVQKKAKSRF